MRRFCWLGLGIVPSAADLRRRGWRLRAMPAGGPEAGADARLPEDGARADRFLLLVDASHRATMRWLEAEGAAPRRRWALVLGVDDPAERARLLALGVGDVLGGQATLAEVDARATRIFGLGEVLPRYRGYGPLRLDLLGRDGFVDDKPLGLHPREFALLWRLLEAPGEQVDKTALLHDVWHLKHMPETNSIAVHASRLRSKLEYVGLSGMVQTAPSGGYFVAPTADNARKLAGEGGGRKERRKAGVKPGANQENGARERGLAAQLSSRLKIL